MTRTLAYNKNIIKYMVLTSMSVTVNYLLYLLKLEHQF